MRCFCQFKTTLSLVVLAVFVALSSLDVPGFPATAERLAAASAPLQGGPASRPSPAQEYDPLAPITALEIGRISLTALRGEREVPILVFLPKRGDAAKLLDPLPIVLFSHGLGGSNTGSTFYGQHLASRGYAVAFLQHAGSDEQVWKDLPAGKRLSALEQAATRENLVLRTQDVTTAIDALTTWNQTKGHPLEGRVDPERIGMSGHSFGAVTTQMVSGQRSEIFQAKLIEPRIDAAIAFSPSPPRLGTPKKVFDKVFLPLMLMTGTKDDSSIGNTDAKARQLVYPALPTTNDRYELVLDGARHSIFTDTAGIRRASARNRNHHRVILALATAFWDAYLKQDRQAAAWLVGDGPKGVMEEADRYQHAAGE